MGDQGQDIFRRDVFPAELRAINARREELRRRDGAGAVFPRALDERRAPSVDHGLVGLALSGGGIRSAAFSLGVLQALHAQGIFPSVDYLSTVSGGGWIGSCLSALMREPGSAFPFGPPPARGPAGAADGATAHAQVIEHLRDRASALVPSGFSGGASMLSRVIRGALITVAMLAATLLAPAVLLAWLTRAWLHFLAVTAQQPQDIARAAEPPWSSFMVATPRLVALSYLALALLPVARTLFQGRRRPPRIDRYFVALGALSLGVFAFETHAFVTYRAARHSYLALREAALDAGALDVGALDVGALDVGALDAGALAAGLGHWLLPLLTPTRTTLVALGVAAAGLAAFRAAHARLLPVLRLAALSAVALASVAPLYLFVLYVSVVGPHFLDDPAAALSLAWQPGILLASALGLLCIVFMDTNEASLHGFFRTHIADLFVVKRAGPEMEREDRVTLGDLAKPGSVAPYHLLNAALNLQGSREASLRGRNCDFFTFSKHYVGGPRTGYCETAQLAALSPGVDLAAAMTISAAAAAPNMGTYTVRPVVLLMAFLNLRLGYWLLNPSEVRRIAGRELGAWERFRAIPAGWCYFRELASALHARGRHVYLSDGGHLENTGAYELLRRRCKYVIICDAEEDPAMRFGGMAALIRFARLDLGVEIEVSLDDLAPDAQGASRRHSVLGAIRYPARDGLPEAVGRLVYIKSSRTGDEHPVIAQYRATNPLFPHESTADQAFGEAQFEAYRALGEHVTLGLAGHSFGRAGAREPVARWFGAMEARVASSPRYDELFPDLRDELEEVDTMLRAPEAAGYFAELYPELVPRQEWAPVAPAALHEIAMRQIHLMASVYTQLRLEDERALEHPWHRGWMETFRRWMASASFRRVWLVGMQSYGPWFRKFCDENFGVSIELRWAPCTREELARHDVDLPPASPDAGARYFLCTISAGPGIELGVASARVGHDPAADGAGPRLDRRQRPGFLGLMSSPEAQEGLDAALAGVGLPAQH